MLKGKRGFITGGASGIGRACVEACLNYGASVVIFDLSDDETLESFRIELGGQGKNCFTYSGDVSKRPEVNSAVEYAVEKLGGLDFAINCAGTAAIGEFMDLSDAEWDLTMKVCLNGTFYSMQAEVEHLKDNGGSVINISSINSTVPAKMYTPYCTAKAGIDMLTKNAALELGKLNIRVNSICPGFTRTPLIEPLLEMDDIPELLEKEIPMKRVGEPQEMAELVAFLASDRCSYLTGENIAVDGASRLTAYPNIFGEDE